MLDIRCDADVRVLLLVIAGPQTSASHESLHAEIAKLDRVAHDRGGPMGIMFLLAPDTPAPDAYWRRRFAEQRRACISPHVFMSLVTESAVIRGVVTAMNWVVPEPPHWTTATHATFDESAGWIERKHGAPKAVLRRLYEDARSPSMSSLKDPLVSEAILAT
jgi:hypothetical protein